MNSKSENNRQKLAEQYEEAAFALELDTYLEAEGQRLWEEFDRTRNEDPEPGQEAFVQHLVEREFAAQRRILRRRGFARMVLRCSVLLAAVLLGAIGLSNSANALRTSWRNMTLEIHERFTNIDFIQPNDADPELNLQNILNGILPRQYQPVVTMVEGSMITVCFQAEEGDLISLSVSDAEGEILVDSQDAQTQWIDFAGTQGYLIRKNGMLDLYWTQEGRLLQFSATRLGEKTYLELATRLATYLLEYPAAMDPVNQTKHSSSQSSPETIQQLLEECIPSGYTLVMDPIIDESTIYLKYQNTSGDFINFTSFPTGQISADTEDAVCTWVRLADTEIYLVEKDSTFTAYWSSGDRVAVLYAKAMDRDMFLDMTSTLISRLYDNPELLHPPIAFPTFQEILEDNMPATYDLVEFSAEAGDIRYLYESPDGRTIELTANYTAQTQLPSQGVWLEKGRFRGWLSEDADHYSLYWDHEDYTLCCTAKPARKEAIDNLAFQISGYLLDAPTTLDDLAQQG